jgi:hypothetical protein
MHKELLIAEQTFPRYHRVFSSNFACVFALATSFQRIRLFGFWRGVGGSGRNAREKSRHMGLALNAALKDVLFKEERNFVPQGIAPYLGTRSLPTKTP